jgi:hypothetical protein
MWRKMWVCARGCMIETEATQFSPIAARYISYRTLISQLIERCVCATAWDFSAPATFVQSGKLCAVCESYSCKGGKKLYLQQKTSSQYQSLLCVCVCVFVLSLLTLLIDVYSGKQIRNLRYVLSQINHTFDPYQTTFRLLPTNTYRKEDTERMFHRKGVGPLC